MVLLLAGCNAPADEPEPSSEAPRVKVTPPLLVVADGTYQWHKLPPPTTTEAVWIAYDVATQTAANPCIFQGHIYFNNRQIPSLAGSQRERSGNVTVRFDWTEADYLGSSLVLGFAAPGVDLSESPRVPRGETVSFRIEGAGNDFGSWNLFACLNREGDDPGSAAWQPGPFVGSFTVHVEFQGDPEYPMVEDDDEGVRTSTR